MSALLETALATLADRDSALRAQVMAKLASLLTFMAQPQAAVSLARAAIEMVRRIGGRDALAYVLDATPYAIWGPDNLVVARSPLPRTPAERLRGRSASSRPCSAATTTPSATSRRPSR